MSNTGGSSWEGMNPEVVQVQARILHGLSEEITALMSKIEAEVAQLADAWHGADANAVRRRLGRYAQAGVHHGRDAAGDHGRHQPAQRHPAAGHVGALSDVRVAAGTSAH